MVRLTAGAAAAVTGLLAFTVYTLTLPPQLTWANFGGDGGELITAAVTLGVPHPPGYPTYVLLGHLVSRLPVGTAAFRLHLFSALCTAAAAALLTASVFRISYSVFRIPIPDPQPTVYDSRLSAHGLPAIAAGLTFAFSGLVWSQAIIAEVYALQLFFVALLLWALLGQRPFWLAGLALGLAVTAHLTSLLLAPLALLLTPRRGWWPLLGGGLLGLTPFLAVPLLAQGNSPVVWGAPVTPGGWWRLISGQLYRPNLFNLDTAEAAARAGEWLPLLAQQFTWLGLPLLAWGLFKWKSGAAQPPRVFVFVGGTAVALLLFAFGYGAADAIVLTLPALLLLAFLLHPGLSRLGPAALLLPLALLLLNFSRQNLSHEDPVNQQTRSLLQTIPPNAIVLTPGDPTIFTLWYYQHVAGYRSDLTLVDSNLFAFDWYRRRLLRHYPHLHAVAEDDLDRFRRENAAERPFCTVRLIPAAIEAEYDCER